MGYGIWFQPIWIGWKVWKKPRHIFHFKKRAWFPRTTWFMDGFHWNINLNLKVEARFSSYLIEQVLLVILILSLHIGNLLFQTPYLILHFSHVTRLFPKPEKYVRFIKLREQPTHILRRVVCCVRVKVATTSFPYLKLAASSKIGFSSKSSKTLCPGGFELWPIPLCSDLACNEWRNVLHRSNLKMYF